MPAYLSLANQESIKKLFELLDWTYNVKLTEDQKMIIVQQVQSGWNNVDQSDVELLNSVTPLHEIVRQLLEFFSSLPASHAVTDIIATLQQEVKTIFKELFSLPVSDDETKIIATVHHAIEELQPGVTEVPIRLAPQLQSQQSSGDSFAYKPFYVKLSLDMMNLHEMRMKALKF